MLDIEGLKEQALSVGFTHAGPLDASTIELMPQVRQMCEKNTCGVYGKNWRCPPGVGSLEKCEETIRRYKSGLIVQTVGQLEDELDGETMMETQQLHMQNLEALRVKLEEQYPSMLTCGAGTCTKCKECTYPDAPCRFPEHSFASMEAYGMLVTQVCQANHIPYYYGPCTIAYTSCFLLE